MIWQLSYICNNYSDTWTPFHIYSVIFVCLFQFSIFKPITNCANAFYFLVFCLLVFLFVSFLLLFCTCVCVGGGGGVLVSFFVFFFCLFFFLFFCFFFFVFFFLFFVFFLFVLWLLFVCLFVCFSHKLVVILNSVMSVYSSLVFSNQLYYYWANANINYNCTYVYSCH